MRFAYVLILFVALLPAHAASPPGGKTRLRELAVFPDFHTSFGWSLQSRAGRTRCEDGDDLEIEINRLNQAIASQPDNLERRLLVACLLEANNQTNAARVAYESVATACRTRLETRPDDGATMTLLGRTLKELGQRAEGDTLLRRATIVSSNDWNCWVAYGNYLLGRSFAVLMGNKDALIDVTAAKTLQKLAAYRPSAAALEDSAKFLTEASRCMDKAVALAPDEAEVYLQRAGYRNISNECAYIVNHARNNEPIDSAGMTRALFPEETLPDLEQAAKLRPQDRILVMSPPWFDITRIMSSGRDEDLHADDFPEATRLRLRNAISALQRLAETAGKSEAAAAYETLGTTQYLLRKDALLGERNLRRAIALDPQRQRAWDMLMTFPNLEFAEKVALCEARIKTDNSARNHLILAKLYKKTENWEAATKQAKIAATLDTNGITARLMLAAIALRQSAQPNFLATAQSELHEAEKLLGREPKSGNAETGERIKEAWRLLTLNAVILNALNDDLEEALKGLKLVLAAYPDDESAKEIQQVLRSL